MSYLRRRSKAASDPTQPLPAELTDEAAFNTYEWEVDENTAWEIARDELHYDGEEDFRRIWRPEMARLIAWMAEYPRRREGRISGSPAYLSQEYAPYRLMCSWDWRDRAIAFVFDIAEHVG